jgi:hypothetical protein
MIFIEPKEEFDLPLQHNLLEGLHDEASEAKEAY